MNKKTLLTLAMTLCVGSSVLAADNYTVTDKTPTQDTPLTAKAAIHTSDVSKIESVLNMSYGNSENFNRYGVMYHDGNILHIGIIDARQREEVMTNLQATNDADLIAHVVVEPTKYSKADYENFMNDSITFFTGKEGPGKVVTATPDAKNERVNLVVTSAKAETVRALQYEFGPVINVVISKK